MLTWHVYEEAVHLLGHRAARQGQPVGIHIGALNVYCRGGQYGAAGGWGEQGGSGRNFTKPAAYSCRHVAACMRASLPDHTQLTISHEDAHPGGAQALGDVKGHAGAAPPAAVCTHTPHTQRASAAGDERWRSAWLPSSPSNSPATGGRCTPGRPRFLSPPPLSEALRPPSSPHPPAHHPPTNVCCDGELRAGGVKRVLDVDAHR